MKLAILLVIVFLVFLITFLIAKRKNKHDFLDIIWGIGFIVSAVVSYFMGFRPLVGLVMTIFVLIWGFRLTWHLAKRIRNSKEDYRYQEYRKEYKGKNFDLYFFFRMYVLQYVLNIIIGFNVIYINLYSNMQFSYITFIGALIWVFGFVFESVGDHQLRVFKKDKENKGKLMTTGLWKYTRHPNYFGEATLWWGLYIMAVSDFNNLWLVFSPVVITLFVRFVSGVPLLEKKYDENGREGWEEYKAKTSVFIPLPPKKG